MRLAFFIFALFGIAALVATAIYIDVALYEAPRAGQVLPDALPASVSLLIQQVFDDTRQNIALNLSALGAAAFLTIRESGDEGHISWVVRRVAFLLVAAATLASVFCASLTTTAAMDMLDMGVFDLHHPWLLWPLRLQYVFLLMSATLLSALAIQALAFGSGGRARG